MNTEKTLYDFLIPDMCDIYARYPADFWERLNYRTILLTGSYGMIASFLVYYIIWLNEVKNFNIRIVSISRNENKFNEKFGEYASRDYISNRVIDILKPIELSDKIDFIIHAASPSQSQIIIKDALSAYLPNVIGTYNLLELAKQKQVESFLFFSSVAVYGAMTSPVSESDVGVFDSLDLLTVYGKGKCSGETLCGTYAKQFGINTKICRIDRIYGSTADMDCYHSAFIEFLKLAAKGENIELTSDGSDIKNHLYIADGAAALLKILLDGKSGEAYNVSNSDELLSILEVAKISAELGKVKVVVPDKQTETASSIVVALNEKLKGLGWNCYNSTKEGGAKVYQCLSYFLQGGK